MGAGTETRAVTELGTGTRVGTGTGSGRVEKLNKPDKSCRRDVGNGGDLSRKETTCRQERIR